jgi:hypothetical protein
MAYALCRQHTQHLLIRARLSNMGVSVRAASDYNTPLLFPSPFIFFALCPTIQTRRQSFFATSSASSLTSPREDNTQDNDHQATMPLGVELTGYRLLTTGVILGVGVPKAVYSYNGQALISTTLDWLAGVIFALM